MDTLSATRLSCPKSTRSFINPSQVTAAQVKSCRSIQRANYKLTKCGTPQWRCRVCHGSVDCRSSVARADRSTGVTAATVVAARARLFGERFRSPGSASSVWRSAALRGHTTRRERGGRGPRGVTVTATWDVVSCGVDRAFTELAELDKSPGSDGRQVINVPELYTGILIVYDKVNQLVPGMHIKPPSKKQVLQLVQDYDINHDGVLDREEFGKLVRHFARTVVARVLINVLLIFSLVPLVVSIASNLAETFGWELPEAIAATVLTLLVKMVGV